MCIFCCLVILYVDLVFYEFFCWPEFHSIKLERHFTAARPLACFGAASYFTIFTVPAMHLLWIAVLLVTGDGLLSLVAAQSQSGR